jgi:hypothetical protein
MDSQQPVQCERDFRRIDAGIKIENAAHSPARSRCTIVRIRPPRPVAAEDQFAVLNGDLHLFIHARHFHFESASVSILVKVHRGVKYSTLSHLTVGFGCR